MAMEPERSKPLHNFTMPRDLRWENQRFLRCMKVNSNASDHSKSSDPRAARGGGGGREPETSGSHRVNPAPPPPPDGCRRFSGVDDGIAAMREKLMFDIQTAADKMKFAIFNEGLREGEAQRPWNLRSRRAACKRFSTAVGDYDGAGVRILTVESNSILPLKKAKSATLAEKSSKLTSDKTARRPKFSVALSKSDIEEDYLVMVGHRPPRRPKKRAKIIQRELDVLFPGLWLTEVTADMYKVAP